jgi:hypothetical protein
MKTLGTLVVALALALSVQTAEAHIVQFVAVVPMTAVDGGQDEAAPQRHGIRPGSSSTSPARSIRTRNGDPGVR